MKKFIVFSLTVLGIWACSNEDSLQLRVASYNLRMDTKKDSINSWVYRKDKVNALISFHDFDLIGTQEGFSHQLLDICRLEEYLYVGVGRDDGQEAGEYSAIFYKWKKFDVLDKGDFWLSETPDYPGKGWDATCCNRICSWAKFRDKKTKQEFYLFNVHFDHQGIIARKESGKLMVQKIREIAGEFPVISTGDYNSLPDTEQILLLSEFLNDSYEITKTPAYGPTGTFTTRFENPIYKGRRIDYIFVSNHFEVYKYAHLTDNDGIYYPSDHIPVSVSLNLNY